MKKRVDSSRLHLIVKAREVNEPNLPKLLPTFPLELILGNTQQAQSRRRRKELVKVRSGISMAKLGVEPTSGHSRRFREEFSAGSGGLEKLGRWAFGRERKKMAQV